MNKKDSLGDRMKCYETVSKNFLMRRQPVIIRLDMKAGHSFTRGFNKPFDEIFIKSMQETMKYLCRNIQGCVLGYTQSDEITLVLCDYQKLDTDAWFRYNVQKITSVSASIATFAFNRSFCQFLAKWTMENFKFGENYNNVSKSVMKLNNSYSVAAEKGALFDSRAFNVPVNEVNNCLLWRQQDATRNSIQSLAQSLYSRKEIEGINTKKLQDKMFSEKGVNWNDLSTIQKRGSCCVKNKTGTWFIDDNIPIFSQNTEYINNRIVFND